METEIKSFDQEVEAGVDEAGRGPIAGPVSAAAVILNPRKKIEGLKDSKKLSAKARANLSDEIKKNALSWKIVLIDREIIDKINILEATLLAMKQAVEGLDVQPKIILIDGENAIDSLIPCKTIVNGDQKVESIMAASILAKVHRDEFMNDLDAKFPDYGFKSHKGYGTREHLLALRLFGACEEHRLSFKPVKDIVEKEEAKLAEETKLKLLVREKLRTLDDDQISYWLKQQADKESSEYVLKLRGLLNEEWKYIKAASLLRKNNNK